MTLAGCGGTKYKLNLEGYGLESKKSEYAEGETVTVVYPVRMIGTDTDYSFLSDDVDLVQDFDSGKGYILTFRMPDHDVPIRKSSRNSMTILGYGE